MKSLLVRTIVTASVIGAAGTAQSENIVKNEIYAMVSGSALLMDVHQPETESRNRAVLFVPGSGWYANRDYQQYGLKDMNSGWVPGDELAQAMVRELVETGFTVFVANHRAAPGFAYPAAQEDIAQAVAYIRSNAERYQIDADSIGGAGTSSGGTLVSMMGVNDNLPDASRLQAVAVQGAPMDFPSLYHSSVGAAGTLTTYIGHSINFLPESHPEYQVYVEASPYSHISSGDAPHLVIHGDQDELVPVTQAERAVEALGKNSVPYALRIISAGMHSEKLLEPDNQWLDEISTWFIEHLE